MYLVKCPHFLVPWLLEVASEIGAENECFLGKFSVQRHPSLHSAPFPLSPCLECGHDGWSSAAVLHQEATNGNGSQV